MATTKDVKGKNNNEQRNWMKKRVGANFIREKVANSETISDFTQTESFFVVVFNTPG